MNLDQKHKSVDFDVLPLGGLNERVVKDFARQTPGQALCLHYLT